MAAGLIATAIRAFCSSAVSARCPRQRRGRSIKHGRVCPVATDGLQEEVTQRAKRVATHFSVLDSGGTIYACRCFGRSIII